MIVTTRMRLVPATVALAQAELTDRSEFARLLSATVPDEWPPEILADALPIFLDWIKAAPDRVGWYVWYAMIRSPDKESDTLVASGGFKGPPQDSMVEIGYSVLPRFQSHGYATEMVQALIDWAFAQPGVSRIIAETTEDNTASMRLLRRLGFTCTEPAAEPGHIRLMLNGRADKDSN
jgi:[ribosomal protein S5]-alanine N-acetyltransferase